MTTMPVKHVLAFLLLVVEILFFLIIVLLTVAGLHIITLAPGAEKQVEMLVMALLSVFIYHTKLVFMLTSNYFLL